MTKRTKAKKKVQIAAGFLLSAEIMQQDNKFNKREKREACNSSCSVSKPKPLITIVTSQQSREKKQREIEI